MKKALFLLSCSLVHAAPYYLPTPPGGGLTPYDWQPTWLLEGLYAKGAHHTPDTCGFRFNLQLYNNGEDRIRHEFGTGIAPQWGNDHRYYSEGFRTRQHVFHLPVTAGYTLNLGITDSIFLFLGGRAGWAYGHYKETAPDFHNSGNYSGFSFSAGGGLKIQCNERLYVQLGYEFGRSYPHNRHHTIWGQHIISTGLGWRF